MPTNPEYTPTPKEIEQETAKIRKEWSAERSRAGGNVPIADDEFEEDTDDLDFAEE